MKTRWNTRKRSNALCKDAHSVVTQIQRYATDVGVVVGAGAGVGVGLVGSLPPHADAPRTMANMALAASTGISISLFPSFLSLIPTTEITRLVPINGKREATTSLDISRLSATALFSNVQMRVRSRMVMGIGCRQRHARRAS
jgi:hypothetical protein